MIRSNKIYVLNPPEIYQRDKNYICWKQRHYLLKHYFRIIINCIIEGNFRFTGDAELIPVNARDGLRYFSGMPEMG